MCVMKTSGKAHGNLWDATETGLRPGWMIGEKGEGGRAGGQSTGSQRIHQAALFAFDGAASRDCAHSPFALIVNNGPPWKIIPQRNLC